MRPFVVVVGSVNQDLVTRVPRLPTPGETVLGGEFARFLGGKGANQALAAAKLGAQVALIGMVGADEAGEAARGQLEQGGVDVSGLASLPNVPTGTAQILVDDAGENLIAVAPGANALLGSSHVADSLAAVLGERSVVVASLEIPEGAVLAAALAARAADCPFILNPAPARVLHVDLVSLCTVITPNEHEIGGLGLSSAERLIQAGAGAVVVTRGADGADLHLPDQAVHHQPPFPVQVIDSTGAGDAFSAGLAWALASDLGLVEAVRIAAATGALATRAAGAQGSLPDAEEVRGLLGVTTMDAPARDAPATSPGT
ncbi:ribokinase [soil metagenome]